MGRIPHIPLVRHPRPPFKTPTTPAARAAQESFEDELIDRLFALNTALAEKE
jgi:hypothetical protein